MISEMGEMGKWGNGEIGDLVNIYGKLVKMLKWRGDFEAEIDQLIFDSLF